MRRSEDLLPSGHAPPQASDEGPKADPLVLRQGPSSSTPLSIPNPRTSPSAADEGGGAFGSPRSSPSDAGLYKRQHLSSPVPEGEEQDLLLSPDTNHSSPVTSERWLEVELPRGGEECLNLGPVMLRDVHLLRTFDVVNRTGQELFVDLDCTGLTDEQLGFQLSNENLQLDEEDHNQLFNIVDRIHLFTLGPYQRQVVILSFLPSAVVPTEASDDNSAASTEPHTSFTVNATINITAKYKQTGGATQTISVHLMAKVCKAEMKVDASEVVFDNSLVGGSYMKDFTIRNLSELPLLLAIKTESTHHGPSSKEKVLEFSDYDTGAAIQDHMVPRFSHVTIRITYRPAQVGDFSYVVRIENVKDPNIVHFINIRSSVVSELRPKAILLNVVNLDYGDCYTGVPVSQTLTVKNVTENILEVFFDSDSSQEVTFELVTENDQPNGQQPSDSDQGEDTSLVDIDADDDELVKPLETSPWQYRKTSKSDTAASHSRIEEINIRPGAEKAIRVWYCPELEESLPPAMIVPESSTIQRQATLARRNFQVFVTCKDHEGQIYNRKIVGGTAKVCTSYIYAPKTEVNLGDCGIGSWRSAVVELLNLSDLPAKVVANYQSKVVTFRQKHVTIPPHQAADLKLDFVPRKINSDYRNQITFVNMHNKNNDQFIVVRANNIDPLRITFHSVFYHLITPYSQNFLDFDNVIVGSPAVRSFIIRNVSGNELKLDFKTSMADELTLCKQGHFSALSQSPMSKTEQLMKRIEENEDVTQNLFRRDEELPDAGYLDLANFGKMKRMTAAKHDLFRNRSREEPPHLGSAQLIGSNTHAEPGTMLSTSPANDLASLTRRLSYTGTLPEKMTKASEEEYIISQEKRFKGVMRALNEGLLVPLTGKHLHLLAGEECVLYVVFRPSPAKRGWLQGKLKKIKESISIRLIGFDKGMLRQVGTAETIIPPRELLVTANICRSIMELTQKNINFGTVFKNTMQQQKALVINNLSEVPLVYRVKKSGSIASLDLVISKDDRVGIVRPYRRKDIHFLFRPTITGAFNEKLVIENIYDKSNNQTITVKALVKPNVTFFIRSLSIDFGTTVLGMKSNRCQIILSNTTKHKRQYEIKVEEDSTKLCDYDILLRLEKTPAIILSKEEEMQVSHLLHRIKIATRKGQEEKKAKYMEQLNKLQAGKIKMESPGASGYSSDVDDSEEKKERNKKLDNNHYSIQKNSIIVNIEGGDACSVVAVFLPKAIHGPITAPDPKTQGMPLEGRLQVFETKNVDVVKRIAWHVTVCPTNEDYVHMALEEGKAPP